MQIPRKKFIIAFLISAFAFQFISNSVLGDDVGLFPKDGNWYPGLDSPTAWKHTVSSIIYPVKYALMEPLAFLREEPDTAPPILLIGFGIYWTAIAWVLHFLCSLFFRRKKHMPLADRISTKG